MDVHGIFPLARVADSVLEGNIPWGYVFFIFLAILQTEGIPFLCKICWEKCLAWNSPMAL